MVGLRCIRYGCKYMHQPPWCHATPATERLVAHQVGGSDLDIGGEIILDGCDFAHQL